MFLHSGKPIGVRDGPQAENQKIKFEGVKMMIEAMGNKALSENLTKCAF